MGLAPSAVPADRGELGFDVPYSLFDWRVPQQEAGPPRVVREGFRTVTPYVIVRDVPALLDFATRAFEAEETGRFTGAGLHAEVRIGDSMLMIGEGGAADDPSIAPAAFHVFVPDVDAAYERAIAAGAKSMGAPIERLIVGSNRNDILTRWVHTGTLVAEDVVPTISPSMDIQVSSNHERVPPCARLAASFRASGQNSRAALGHQPEA